MSELTPDDVRRKAVLDSIPESAEPAGPPRNPYLIALVVLTAILGSIALIIYAVRASSYDPVFQGQLLPVANTWSILALVALLVTLVVGGLTWKPAPSA